MLTATDIQAEHETALAALTPQQRAALDRLAKARREAAFNHRWPAENLVQLFEREAEARNALELAA